MGDNEENTNMPDEGTEARNIQLLAQVAHLESLLQQNQPAAAAAPGPPAPPVQFEQYTSGMADSFLRNTEVGSRTVIQIRPKRPKATVLLGKRLHFQKNSIVFQIKMYTSTDGAKHNITLDVEQHTARVLWIPLSEMHVVASENNAERMGRLFPGGLATDEGFDILKIVILALLDQNPGIAIGNTFFQMKGSRQPKTIETQYGVIKHYAPQVPKVETSMQTLAQQMMMLMMGGPAKNTVFCDNGAGSHSSVNRNGNGNGKKRQRNQKNNGSRN
jgi:hypothetical protein